MYDPLDVRPAELEREPIKNEVTDQRLALNLFGNGLVFHSDPFPEAVEITGYLKLVAWIALDVPDTDFAVKVYEIKPDGTSIALADDLKRARYRESLRQEKLVKPGAIERYEFDSFNFFSRRLEKGSRLRLVFSSPNSIYLEKNYNSGGEVAAESRADARTAHVALYQDAEHASYLEVPIVRASSGKAVRCFDSRRHGVRRLRRAAAPSRRRNYRRSHCCRGRPGGGDRKKRGRSQRTGGGPGLHQHAQLVHRFPPGGRPRAERGPTGRHHANHGRGELMGAL